MVPDHFDSPSLGAYILGNGGKPMETKILKWFVMVMFAITALTGCFVFHDRDDYYHHGRGYGHYDRDDWHHRR